MRVFVGTLAAVVLVLGLSTAGFCAEEAKIVMDG